MTKDKSELTILFVEDRGIFRRSATTMFERRGHLVLQFSEGREVIDKAREGLEYDVALVDRSIPDVDGDEVTIELKRLYPKRPIINVSGYGISSPYADANIRKPVRFNVLYGRIKEVVANSP